MTSNIYYDISYFNDKSTPQIVSLFDNRTSALINYPSNYELSIVRFTIPTSYVPIFEWKTTDVFTVTINNSQVALIYVPENNFLTTDPAYRFVYSYDQFIKAINVAFNTAFIASAPVGVATPPYMIFNPESGLFSLIAEDGYSSHSIFMNQALYSFFDNFYSKNFGFGNALGKDVQIYVENLGNNDYTGHPPSYPSSTGYYIMTQNYNSTFMWNSARALVLTTNTIPVASEAINVRNSSIMSSGNVYRKILTDFEFNIQNGLANNTLRSYAHYLPTAEYRMISLLSDSPLYTFDINVYFQMKDLTLYPLYINPNESVSMKVLFRKK